MQIGARVGLYEVTARIGAGGMGDVYRARDTKLGREVALKTLPDAFASDPDRVARFQREARILASLNHPHIAAIYGLEEGPPVFLVLELVEGEDLSQRIARGPIPFEEALSIARQIADALEAAHDSGVIHRDLKPANIKIRSDGAVKVLDFGLAKALDPGPDTTNAMGGDLTESPTITSPFGVAQGGPLHVTGPAVILGTAPYMSPEQARGRPVDRRGDVWAFGAVLYEMLTGRPAFPGHDVPDTLAAILRAIPNWSALPPGLPIAITRLLHRTLEKDVRSRLSDMAMVRLELRDAERAPVDDAAAILVSRSARSTLGRIAPYVAAIGLAIATGLAVWRVSQDARTPGPLVRFSVDLPAQMQPTAGSVAISPDGTHLVFVANQRLYVRALDEVAASPIPGTEARGPAGFGPWPFFSPDGTWIAFWQEGRLRKVPLDGGAVETICDTPPPIGASWGANDEILLGLGAQGVGLVKASGGMVQTLVPVKEGERAVNPQMLPGGDWVLFSLLTGRGVESVEAQVVAQSRSNGDRRLLFDGAQNARYISSGHLLFSRAGALFAQAFDADRVTPIGGQVSMLESGGNMPLMAAINFAVSATGTLLYRPAAPLPVTALTRLVLVARDGTRSILHENPGMTWYPRFSHDGSRVAYGISVGRSTGGTSDLWVVDVARRAPTRVTFADDTRFYPIWTKDDTRLTFADGSLAANRVLSALADGSGGLQTLIPLGIRKFPTSWSRDGSALALYMGGSAGGVRASRDIWMWHSGDKPVLSPFVETTFEERGAIFSPDGHWIAYVSDKSSQNDVVARPYPGPGREVTISVGGGQEPVWGPFGRELFYRHDNKLLVVTIDATATSLRPGLPARVFDDPYVADIGGAAGGMANYDISPDGKRFVFVEEPASPAAAPPEPVRLQVILNWLDDLKRRVPLK